MTEILLAIIAACLLFGGAAVLGFFSVLLYIVLGLVGLFIAYKVLKWFVDLIDRGVAAMGTGISGNKGGTGALRPAKLNQSKRSVPRIKGCRFKDYDDYLDWANKRGRWADGGTTGTPSSV